MGSLEEDAEKVSKKKGVSGVFLFFLFFRKVCFFFWVHFRIVEVEVAEHLDFVDGRKDGSDVVVVE